MLADELRAKTESLLREFDPDVVVGVRRDREGTYLDLRPAPDADYRFILYVGEPQIHAELLGVSKNRNFWYWPFAEQDYGSLAEQEDHFFECIRLLLAYPTRIVQRKTLLGVHFRCEAESEAGVKPIGGSLGVWFGVPKILEREHVYHSRPIATSSAV